MWLERLGDEQFPDKELRNEYLQRLWKEIEEGVLEHPFTEPPPAGDLPSLSESNHVDKEVQYSPRCTKRRVSAKGEGDAPFFTGTVAAENKTPEAYGDESSWQDMSEHSPPSSEGKENSEKVQTRIIDQLRQENNELLIFFNKHNDQQEVIEVGLIQKPFVCLSMILCYFRAWMIKSLSYRSNLQILCFAT